MIAERKLRRQGVAQRARALAARAHTAPKAPSWTEPLPAYANAFSFSSRPCDRRRAQPGCSTPNSRSFFLSHRPAGVSAFLNQGGRHEARHQQRSRRPRGARLAALLGFATTRASKGGCRAPTRARSDSWQPRRRHGSTYTSDPRRLAGTGRAARLERPPGDEPHLDGAQLRAELARRRGRRALPIGGRRAGGPARGAGGVRAPAGAQLLAVSMRAGPGAQASSARSCSSTRNIALNPPARARSRSTSAARRRASSDRPSASSTRASASAGAMRAAGTGPASA